MADRTGPDCKRRRGRQADRARVAKSLVFFARWCFVCARKRKARENVCFPSGRWIYKAWAAPACVTKKRTEDLYSQALLRPHAVTAPAIPRRVASQRCPRPFRRIEFSYPLRQHGQRKKWKRALTRNRFHRWPGHAVSGCRRHKRSHLNRRTTLSHRTNAFSAIRV